MAYVRAANAVSTGLGSGPCASPRAIIQPVTAAISPQRTAAARVLDQVLGVGRSGVPVGAPAAVVGGDGNVLTRDPPSPAPGTPRAARCWPARPCSIRPAGPAGRRSRW